jgi:hypothetical protein
MKHLRFRFLALIAAAFALCFLGGCVVLSIYPFYTEKDLAFDEALLGKWVKTTEADERWVFEKEGSSAYKLILKSGQKTYLTSTHLFKVNGELFLDMFEGEGFATESKGDDNIFPPRVPTHTLFKVFQTKPTLRLAIMNYEWLDKLLVSEPKALRHHLVLNGKDKEDRFPVLTADTAELQAFLIKHSKTAEAWQDTFDLKREAAASNFKK